MHRENHEHYQSLWSGPENVLDWTNKHLCLRNICCAAWHERKAVGELLPVLFFQLLS